MHKGGRYCGRERPREGREKVKAVLGVVFIEVGIRGTAVGRGDCDCGGGGAGECWGLDLGCEEF